MHVTTDKKLMLAASVVILLNFSSCKKYEDGPAFALSSKTARLTGEWEVISVDGEDFFEEATFTLEFDKGGDFSIGISYDGYSYSYDGDWEWGSSKESIEVEMDDERMDWDILRLSKDELWFEDEDGLEWKCEKQ